MGVTIPRANFLPRTNVRLVQAVKLYASFPGIELPTFSLFGRKLPLSDLATNFGDPIGQLDTFTVTQDRENIKRYSLGQYAYEPYDIIPGKITTSIDVEKGILYGDPNKPRRGDFMAAIGMHAGQFIYQQRPFIIKQVMMRPGAKVDAPLEPEETIFYFNCWFRNNVVKFSIHDEDGMLTHNVKIDCGNVVSSKITLTERFAVPVARRVISTVINFATKSKF